MPAEIFHFELQPCTIRAWRVDLDVLFRNLIDNAVKYAGSEPRVGIHLRRTADGRAIVRITDNGRGIPGRFRRQIFRRFERLGLELERERPGTGLGLYIVRNIARRLKARIRVRDSEPGPGTVFEVQTARGGGAQGQRRCPQPPTAENNVCYGRQRSTSWSSKTKSTWRWASSTTSWPRATA